MHVFYIKDKPVIKETKSKWLHSAHHTGLTENKHFTAQAPKAGGTKIF
uniref:Uncharacterized protein n=1 Tax=Anguilla anguilla TaxID=7936 RepID=A0A0E9X677_ANGAN